MKKNRNMFYRSCQWCIKCIILMLNQLLRIDIVFEKKLRQYSEIFTARKQSLRQGDVFTSVCQSFFSRGWWLPSMYHWSHDRGHWLPSIHHRSQGVRGLHPGGGGGSLPKRGWVCLQRCLYLEAGGGWANPLPNTMEYNQQVGSTHPAGMLSCNNLFLYCYVLKKSPSPSPGKVQFQRGRVPTPEHTHASPLRYSPRILIMVVVTGNPPAPRTEWQTPVKTRMHSPWTHYSLWTEWHTPVKTLPSPYFVCSR